MRYVLAILATLASFLIYLFAVRSGRKDVEGEYSKRQYFSPSKYYRLNGWKLLGVGTMAAISLSALLHFTRGIDWETALLTTEGSVVVLTSLLLSLLCIKRVNSNILFFENGKVVIEFYDGTKSITVFHTNISYCRFEREKIYINGKVDVRTLKKSGSSFIENEKEQLNCAIIDNHFKTNNQSVYI